MINQFENLSAESEVDRLAQVSHCEIFMDDIRREIRRGFDLPPIPRKGEPKVQPDNDLIE